MTAVLALGNGAISRLAHDPNTTQYVCWSRMQAEAGQELQAILRRKELERRAGNGMFCWGVGNAPSVVASALARLGHPVPAIFSIMKSRPKSDDLRPARTVAWRRYVDVDGSVRPLPSHVLVTSRADSATGPKTRHFALVCGTERPLELRRGQRFDPSAFRNAGGAGAPVGSSQVTALLRRISNEIGDTAYEVNLSAWLVGGYWVRLVDPVECSPKFDEVDDLKKCSVQDWVEFVARVRGSSAVHLPVKSPQGMLF